MWCELGIWSQFTRHLIFGLNSIKFEIWTRCSKNIIFVWILNLFVNFSSWNQRGYPEGIWNFLRDFISYEISFWSRSEWWENMEWEHGSHSGGISVVFQISATLARWSYPEYILVTHTRQLHPYRATGSNSRHKESHIVPQFDNLLVHFMQLSFYFNNIITISMFLCMQFIIYSSIRTTQSIINFQVVSQRDVLPLEGRNLLTVWTLLVARESRHRWFWNYRQ